MRGLTSRSASNKFVFENNSINFPSNCFLEKSKIVEDTVWAAESNFFCRNELNLLPWKHDTKQSESPTTQSSSGLYNNSISNTIPCLPSAPSSRLQDVASRFGPDQLNPQLLEYLSQENSLKQRLAEDDLAALERQAASSAAWPEWSQPESMAGKSLASGIIGSFLAVPFCPFLSKGLAI